MLCVLTHAILLFETRLPEASLAMFPKEQSELPASPPLSAYISLYISRLTLYWGSFCPRLTPVTFGVCSFLCTCGCCRSRRAGGFLCHSQRCPGEGAWAPPTARLSPPPPPARSGRAACAAAVLHFALKPNKDYTGSDRQTDIGVLAACHG